MKITPINSCPTIFTYDEIENFETSVFLIEREKFYLIDTFCGPQSMLPILEAIHETNPQKEVVVINTHFHWDHVWGNCSFANCDIIAHELCRQMMDEGWDLQMQRNEKYVMGNVVKQLPKITFSQKLIFHKDGLELFHSPGHTKDCISIFDHEEGILYVGDNLEKPLIYVEDPDVTTYIATLKNYLNYKPKKIIGSHTLEITETDLMRTIDYLEGLLSGKEMQFATEYEKQIHEQNWMAMLNT